MQRQRLTDKDKNLGPLTWGPSNWKCLRFAFRTGDDEEEAHQNSLVFNMPGLAVRLWLPNIMEPHKIRHEANWDEETVKRKGRNHYFETQSREYGVCMTWGEGPVMISVDYGRQTMDSDTDQSWSHFPGWGQWRFVRKSYYDLQGIHFADEPRGTVKQSIDNYRECRKIEQACPKEHFLVRDESDGTQVIVTTYIEEMEWRYGDKWFKWLSFFRKPKIKRCLDLRFNKEVGPGKKEWKGGLIGHGIEMRPGELHEEAMRRYCSKEHNARRGRTFRLTFLGRSGPPPNEPRLVPIAPTGTITGAPKPKQV